MFKYEIEVKTTYYETFRIERETPLTDEERDLIEEHGEDFIPETCEIQYMDEDEQSLECIVTEILDKSE